MAKANVKVSKKSVKAAFKSSVVCERDEYKGHQLLKLYDKDAPQWFQKPLSFGYRKACWILEHIEKIEAFVEECAATNSAE